MCFTAIAGLAGAAISSRSASKAADAQAATARNQTELAENIFNTQDEYFQPYREAGGNALAAYNSELGLGAAPEGYTAFGADTDPNFGFAMSQGMNALDGSAAMNGGLFSGATMQAAQQFGQNTAMGYRDNYLNRLSGLAGAGQASAAQSATAAGNLGTVQSQALTNQGNAASAGYVAQGNAWNQGIGNALGAYQYQQVANPNNGGITIGGSNSLFGGNSWG